MTDGKLAVIGLGGIGSMALWQASRLSDSVTGFEAASPAHGRSAVGGDTRLFRPDPLRRTLHRHCRRARDPQLLGPSGFPSTIESVR